MENPVGAFPEGESRENSPGSIKETPQFSKEKLPSKKKFIWDNASSEIYSVGRREGGGKGGNWGEKNPRKTRKRRRGKCGIAPGDGSRPAQPWRKRGKRGILGVGNSMSSALFMLWWLLMNGWAEPWLIQREIPGIPQPSSSQLSPGEGIRGLGSSWFGICDPKKFLVSLDRDSQSPNIPDFSRQGFPIPESS